MKFVFLRAFDFPIGGASQNRLLSICKSLNYENQEVLVCQYMPSKLDIKENCTKFQIYNDVKIYNFASKYSPITCKKDFLFGSVIGLWNVIFFLFKEHKKSHIDFVSINTTNIFILLIFKIVSKILSCQLSRDLNEYPNYILFDRKKNFFSDLSYKFFDRVYCISSFLCDFYKPKLKKNAKCMLLPMSVDEDRFNFHYKNDIKSNTFISYCGDLSEEKDGVISLIKSFSLIHEKFPKLKLQLIGTNKNSFYVERLLQLVEELSLSNKIIFTGFVNPQAVPDCLYKSRLLVLARPNNKQAEGGFPTKLGEYLLTGVPVVLTDVGDVSKYLIDRFSAYIASSNDPIIFSQKIAEALLDENFIQVGETGKKVALNKFSYKKQGKLLLDFFKQ